MTTALKISELEKMPNGERSMLLQFVCGIDVKKCYSNMTFWKYRNALKKKGFDISKQVKTTHAPQTESLEISRKNYL